MTSTLLRTAFTVLAAGAMSAQAQQTFSSPAHDLFDEVVYHLKTKYGGPSDVDLNRMEAAWREELDRACENDREACSTETAVPVLTEMVAALNDGHTSFVPKAYADELLRRLANSDGSTAGYGALLRGTGDGSRLLIVEVTPGSAAQRAGLRRGDVIVNVGDTSISGAAGLYGALVKAGRAGSSVSLVILRYGAEFPVTVGPPTRNEELPHLRVRPDGVAVLRIPQFLTAEKVGRKVFDLLGEKALASARGVVVDVRDNPGGAPSECITAAAGFIPEIQETLVRRDGLTFRAGFTGNGMYNQIGSGARTTMYTVDTTRRYAGPVVVLVNARSASCAEFFTRFLQTAGRATVLGEPTRGVGNSSVGVIELSDGSALRVTGATSVDAQGNPHPERVTPDIPLKDDVEAQHRTGRDDLLERAAWLIKRGEAPSLR